MTELEDVSFCCHEGVGPGLDLTHQQQQQYGSCGILVLQLVRGNG